MKGQMFIILAIIVITILIVLKLSLNINNIIERNKSIKSDLSNLQIQNIERGIKQALISSYNLFNISENVNYFINFVRLSELGKGNILSGISVQSIYPYVKAGETTIMNTSVYNFLGLKIDNLTLIWNNGTNYSQSFSNLEDNSTIFTTFSFTATSNTNYTLLVKYIIENETITKNITIPVSIGNSKFIGFYSIKLSTVYSNPSIEFTNVVTLNQTQYT
jgi:predicted Holliday junction resolvase-like endonuclease